MVPSVNDIQSLHKRYAFNDADFELVFGHCQIVNEIAQWCVNKNNLEVDEKLLEAACLLHDIGTYGLLQDATGSKKFYPQHAILGATILKEEGMDDKIVEIVRTHVLLGLNKEDIEKQGWALPLKDFEPKTLEAKVLCYADRFHSKSPHFNSAESFMNSLEKDLPNQAKKFKAMIDEFGLPDVDALAQKYQHPIR